jgi:DNA-binding winged helix-turn-helix (wHTH) protein
MSTQSQAITYPEANTKAAAISAFPARYVRFGAFQADLEREELYQGGQRVKVQSKVFQSLLLLLSRPGEIVTREEVRRQLWPDTLLANLDANVNTTMNKLRQVLGDSPETPVYVETIPRRGYSFIANVEFSSGPDAPPEATTPSAAQNNAGPAAADVHWFAAHVPEFLKAASLLFAGIILGALLAFVWFFAAAKNQHSASSVRANASSAQLPFHDPSI